MPIKKDADTTAGVKLLRLFRKLMIDGRRHFQADLAEEFHCSNQTIIRLMTEIEHVIGLGLESGFEKRKKWYRIKSTSRAHLGIERDELRYLAICRDLAASLLPQKALVRIDETLFSLSVLMADPDYVEREAIQGRQCAFFSKGKIDYTPHYVHLESISQAIESQQVLLVRYRAAGGTDIREHRFVPGKIIAMSNALYVLGATLVDDFSKIKYFTNLAVHRMVDVIVLKRAFIVKFPCTTEQAFGLPWHEPRTFRIHFAAGKVADYVRERVWASEQRIEEAACGALTLHITTRSEPELMAWVRSFGDGVLDVQTE